MILKSYEFTNWGPHKNKNIIFPDGAKTIALIGENDQGKSWVVRGLGFVLSIGRNEYGDKTSIHDGETISTHKLVILHNNEEYTIEKIINGETETTETLINGNQVLGAAYEEFYNKTLGLSHPSVWLPIVISMQNQTDYYLRSRKSDREEALRAACQLTKIDNWKDALQTKTNEEDKKLLEESATQKSKIETLKKELSNQNKKEEELLNGLQEIKTLAGGIELTELWEILLNYDEKTKNLKKVTLELENIEREERLQENAKVRLEKELETIPGISLQEETNLEEERELLSTESNARAKHSAVITSIARNKQLKTKKKELNELGNPPSNIELEKIEEKLEEIKQNTIQKKEKELALETILKECPQGDFNLAIKTCEEKEEQLNTLWLNFNQTTQKEKEVKDQLEELLQKKITSETEEEIKKELEKLSEKYTPFGKGPIKEAEAHELLARILENWEEHNHEECPICCQSLKKIKTFQNKTIRESVLEELKKETPEHHEDLQALEKIQRTIINLPLWTTAKEKKTVLLQKTKELGITPENLRSASQQETLKRNRLENNKELKKTISTLEEKIKNLLKEHFPSSENKEEAETAFKKLREKYHTTTILKKEIENLEQEIQKLDEEIDRLEESPDPSRNPEIEKLDPQMIKSKLKEISEKLSESKKNKEKKFSKEKELIDATNKWELTKKALETTKENIHSINKTLEEGGGMPPQKETWEETYQFWKKQEKEAQRIKTLLEEIPSKKEELNKEINQTEEELEKTNQKVRMAHAARKLVNFLDYKNAPRKLLQNITEKLFQITNRLGELLQVDIRLKVGKNLEFLSHQLRAGRWIEQKTERLGFGKGAILGICFRLACQKLILPETGFLILDEPTANVDQKRKTALKSFLQNLGEDKESKTKQIILIEHDQNVIELCQAKININ